MRVRLGCAGGGAAGVAALGDSARRCERRALQLPDCARQPGGRRLLRRGDAVDEPDAESCRARTAEHVRAAVGLGVSGRSRPGALAATGLFLLLFKSADGRPVLAARRLATAALLAVMFGPYAVFHLVFQETVTVRYALPLVLPIAYLVAVSLTETRPGSRSRRRFALVAASMLWLAVPAGSRVRAGFQVRSSARSTRCPASPSPAAIVGMHRRVWTESRRARRWRGEPPGQLLAAPRDYEWLELTRAWRARDVPVTWFVADPRRTDLALIDPASRQLVSYRWPFRQRSYAGGARPDEVDLVTIGRPGWFLEQGWALTPEVAGVTGRDGGGPHKRPSVGWVRSRPGESLMMIGGRHLGGAADPPVRVHVALEDRPILNFIGDTRVLPAIRASRRGHARGFRTVRETDRHR